jgi:putative membrane protein
MMWRYPYLAGGLGWLWFIVAVAIIAAAVALILWVVLRPRGTRETRAPGPPPPARDPAMEILRERLARGEINAAEFEEAKRILGG